MCENEFEIIYLKKNWDSFKKKSDPGHISIQSGSVNVIIVTEAHLQETFKGGCLLHSEASIRRGQLG